MGTPYHNHPYRSDNKVYKIWCPQSPLVKTEMYNAADMDTHPQGTNAIVAVITYTGYDMEDAMIINKGSFHRGFGHGMVYKTKIVEAANSHFPLKEQKDCKFSNVVLKKDSDLIESRHCHARDEDGQYRLNDDGLPRVGSFLQQDDPLYCT